MDLELRIAVEFLLSFVVNKFKVTDTEAFIETLLESLREKFKGHWYPDQPSKGSGYRCISLCDQLDNILVTAAQRTGFDVGMLSSSLPTRLDVFIDPREVSYRIGVYGSVTQIYREGDDEVNFKSEYAVAIMRNRPASKTEDKTTSSSAGKQQAARFSSKDDRHRVQPVPNVSQPQDRKSPMKDQNRLSPTARSFVSRCSPPLPVQVPHSRTMPSPVYPSKPVPSFDHTRKAYWQPAPVYPVANMQAHNFILAHEIARFEAHMKAQRMAVQTHYYKSPFPPAASRRMPVQYKTIHLPVQPTTSNGHLRVQVGA